MMQRLIENGRVVISRSVKLVRTPNAKAVLLSRVALDQLKQLVVRGPRVHFCGHPPVTVRVYVSLLDEDVQIEALAREHHVSSSQREGRAEVVGTVAAVQDALVLRLPLERLQFLPL